MVITLSSDQQRQLLEWARQISQAHVESNCMPPGYTGYTLHVEFGGPFGADAWASSGTARIELGEVAVALS